MGYRAYQEGKSVMKTINRWMCAVCLGLLVALMGCGSRVDPVAFNRSITDDNKKLNAAGTKLGEALKKTLNGEPGSTENLKAEYASLQKTLADVKADVANLKVPNDASSKALYDAYQKFLQGQESMSTNEFSQIVKCAEDASIPTAQKVNTIVPLIKTVEQRENTDLTALKAAQSTFATEHHITLQ